MLCFYSQNKTYTICVRKTIPYTLYNMTPHFDIIGIGDTVVDAFINLEIGHVEQHSEGAEYCIPFGMKVPYKEVTVIPGVGNSANGVVSAARLGLKTSLVTFLGKDANGLECINRLQKEGVNMDFATQEDGKKTNYHYVLLHGGERTILIKHEAFKATLPDIGTPSWMYLSSLGSHTKSLHEEIMDYLEKNPEVKLAFQPGTFQIEMGKEMLARLYKRADIFCANKEEFQQILGTQEGDVKVLMTKMSELGPKLVLLSDGPHGAYMKNGDHFYQIGLYPETGDVIDRTGAGDAFCSTFVSFVVKGKSPEDALLRAPINSMSVVLKIGAQEGLLSEEKIEELLKKAPESYKVVSL